MNGISIRCLNIFAINIVNKAVVIKKGMKLKEKLNFNKKMSK